MTGNIGKNLSDSGKQWVKKDPDREDVFWPNDELKEKAWLNDPEIYEKAREDPKAFWAEQAKEAIDWFEEWDEVEDWNPPYFNWFINSKTNLAYNCIDRHLEERRNKAAIIWEPEPMEEEGRIITYQDLYREVNKFANALKNLGVEKGDAVTFWMPMIPETAIAALACQRIGAWHSIVYTAFSPEAVKDRMQDAGSDILITADGFYRGGKVISLKEKIGDVLDDVGAENCVVINRADSDPSMKEGRDHFFSDLVDKAGLF